VGTGSQEEDMNRLDQKAEPLDSLMGAYFRAEMPEPWPTFDRRRTAVLPSKPEGRPASWWATYSRFALALSVFVLLGGAWLLGGPVIVPGDRTPHFGVDGGTADRGKIANPKPTKNNVNKGEKESGLDGDPENFGTTPKKETKDSKGK